MYIQLSKSHSMNRITSLILLCGLVLGISACTQQQSEADIDTVEAPEGKTSAIQSPDIVPPEPEVSLYCRELVGPEEGNPQSEVGLMIDEQQHILDTISVCMTIVPSDYERYEIPAEAISAAGGWFAGGGDYLYALRSDKGVTVMAGWEDEMDPDGGFHYQVKKEFPLGQ